MTPDEKYKLEKLKADWLRDPCWDIEKTDGFEAHKPELLAFRVKTEEAWRVRREQALADFAIAIGVPGNTQLALFIERLESKIARLEERVEELAR